MLEVRRSLETQHPSASIDFEGPGIGTARDGVSQIGVTERIIRRDRCDRRLVLGHADGSMIQRKHLCVDVQARGIIQRTAGVVPRYREPPVVQSGDNRIVLVTRDIGVDQELAADLFTGGIEHLRLDAQPIGVPQSAAGVAPSHHEAAVA